MSYFLDFLDREELCDFLRFVPLDFPLLAVAVSSCNSF